MIWIIGGTSEGREIVDKIRDLEDYLVTIATDEGKEFLNSERVFIGRMDYDAMMRFGKANSVKLIVDLSHPYAKIVSENARTVARNLKIKYIRYVRENTEFTPNTIYLRNYEEAYKYLSKVSGTVFFTTGSKNIGDFEKIKGSNRFIYRIIPAMESMKICKKHGISMKNIIAVLGPFSKEYNRAMFKEYNPKYCVMKDSGKKGGTLEKVLACEDLAIIPIIIGREAEKGIIDLDLVERLIRRVSKGGGVGGEFI